MKARIKDDQKVLMSRQDIQRICNAEYENKREEMFKEVASDIMTQALCVVYYTLITSKGWREKRLKDFTAEIKATNDLMCNPSKLHHRFNPIDIEEMLKSKYGIDLREEFKPTIEVK